MYKISNEIIKFIEKVVKNWKVELTAGGKGLAQVKIQSYFPGRWAICGSDDATQSHT